MMWFLVFARKFGDRKIQVILICSLLATIGFIVYFRTFKPLIFMCFIGGFVAAYAVRNAKIKAFCQSKAGAVVVVVGMGAAFLAGSKFYAPLPIAALSVCFVMIACGQSFGGFLTSRPMMWLGEISYGVYLLHGVVLWLLISNAPVVVQMIDGREEVYIAALCGVGTVLIAVAGLAHVAIERPGIRYGKSLLRRPARPATECA